MSIKREVGFGVNSFNKANVKSNAQSIADLIMLILLSKPGDIPNLPYLGIDIKKYIYGVDELTTNELKDAIYNQCSELYNVLLTQEISVFTVNPDGAGDVLVLYIPIVIDGEIEDTAIFAFGKDSGMNVSYKYSLESVLNQKSQFI